MPINHKADDAFHQPVMVTEVAHWLITKPGGIYVDLTCGGGGHSAYILDLLDDRAILVGIDRDGEAIKAAMEFSRTSTGKKHRGKGMSELLHFPQSIERFQSSLTIYSGKGKYVEITKGNKTISRKAETLNKNLKGTLIEWRVSL